MKRLILSSMMAASLSISAIAGTANLERSHKGHGASNHLQTSQAGSRGYVLLGSGSSSTSMENGASATGTISGLKLGYDLVLDQDMLVLNYFSTDSKYDIKYDQTATSSGYLFNVAKLKQESLTQSGPSATYQMKMGEENYLSFGLLLASEKLDLRLTQRATNAEINYDKTFVYTGRANHSYIDTKVNYAGKLKGKLRFAASFSPGVSSEQAKQCLATIPAINP